jgi:hypothetical protein
MSEPELEHESEGEPKGQASEASGEEGLGQREEPNVLYPAVKDEWYRDRDVELSFDLVDFDYMGVHGQARPFSKVVYEERLHEMAAALPVGPLKITVWPADIHGVPFILKTRVFKSLLSPSQTPSSWSSVANTAARRCWTCERSG